jgi:hypothetical protein
MPFGTDRRQWLVPTPRGDMAARAAQFGTDRQGVVAAAKRSK